MGFGGEPHTNFPKLPINSKYSIWRRDRLFKQRRFLERKHREKVDPLSLKYEELFFVMFSIFSSLIIFPCIIKDNTINILSYGPGVVVVHDILFNGLSNFISLFLSQCWQLFSFFGIRAVYSL